MELWQALLVLAVAAGLIAWRWAYVSRRRLSDPRCRELAEMVVADLAELAPDANVPVPVSAAYWRSGNLDPLKAVELSRWMVAYGFVWAGSWGRLDILLGSPPRALALTPRSMSRALRSDPTTIIDSGGGPINYGSGTQFNAGGSITISNLYRDLSDAVRLDAGQLSGLERSQALSAAETLAGIAEGSVDAESPRARGTIDWLRERVDEAVGNAMGSALWAATAAALARLFA